MYAYLPTHLHTHAHTEITHTHTHTHIHTHTHHRASGCLEWLVVADIQLCVMIRIIWTLPCTSATPVNFHHHHWTRSFLVIKCFFLLFFLHEWTFLILHEWPFSSCFSLCHYSGLLRRSRSGVLQMQKYKTYLLRTQSTTVLPLKPGVGQNIAMHALQTVRDFILANFYLPNPTTFIFFPHNISGVFPVLAVANAGFCVGPQNLPGHPAHRHRQLMQLPVLSASGIETGLETCVIVHQNRWRLFVVYKVHQFLSGG